MAGLRDLWGLGEIQDPLQGVAGEFAELRSNFQRAIAKINKSLQFTAANARPGDHLPLAERRDALYVVYQQAMQEGTNQEVALIQATTLQVEADRLKSKTEQAKNRYDRILIESEQTQQVLTTAGEESARDVATIRKQLEQSQQFARERDYHAAIKQYKSAEIQAKKLSLSNSPPEVNEKKFPLQGPLAKSPQAPTNFNDLENWKNPLINGDPKDLFTPEKMDDVVKMHFDGEGDKKLNEAMEGLLFPQEGEDPKTHLATIAKIRGMSDKQVADQFARFQQLQAVSKQVEETRELEHDETYDNNGAEFKKQHPDFLGTRSNLRFGQVVGEATGLDPVFAGMLNPTGGMVGPGMDHLAPTDADSPVVWHGIFHDAGGYMLNHQNTGPGYSYLPHIKPESGRRGSDPFQGQVEGVSYWYEREFPDKPILEIFLKDILAQDKQRTAYDAYIKQPVDDTEQFAKDLTTDAVDKVGEVADDARGMNRNAAAELKGATHRVAKGVNSAVAAADEAVDSFAAGAKKLGVNPETVDDAEKSIEEQLAAIRNQVTEWDQQVSGGIDQASQFVDESIDDIEQWTDEAGNAVKDKITEYADDAREGIHNKLVELGENKEVIDFARRAVDKFGETKEDAKALKREVEARVARAEAEVTHLYSDAKTAVREKIEAGEAIVDESVEKLAAARDYLTDKLDQVRNTASRGADVVAKKIDSVGNKIVETGQDIRDAASGVVDGMADAVDSGTDAIANTAGAATDWAAGKLGKLTTLFG